MKKNATLYYQTSVTGNYENYFNALIEAGVNPYVKHHIKYPDAFVCFNATPDQISEVLNQFAPSVWHN